MTPSQNEVNVEMANASFRSLVKLVPLLGNLVIDFSQARSRLEQKRINDFVYRLIEKIGGDENLVIDKDHLKSEEFEDFMVHLLDRLRRAKTEKARERLLNVLLGAMAQPVLSEYMDRVIDILTDLGDRQVMVLHQIAKQSPYIQSLHVKSTTSQEKWKKLLDEKDAYYVDSDKIPMDAVRKKLQDDIELAKKEMMKANDEIYRFTCELRNLKDIDAPHLAYCLQDLFSKSLVRRVTIPNRNSLTNVDEVYVTSELGQILLGYVLGKENE